MPDDRFKSAYDATVEDAEKARAQFVEKQKLANTMAGLDAVETLQKGGFTFSSIKNDPKGGLRIALGKDTMVHRLPNGTYGLLEWLSGREA
jgi:hypothetical protein